MRTTGECAAEIDSACQWCNEREAGEEEWGMMAGGRQKWTLLQNEQTSQESTELN